MTLVGVDYAEIEARTAMAVANQNRDIYTIGEKERTFLLGRTRHVLHVEKLEFPRVAVDFVSGGRAHEVKTVRLGDVSERSSRPNAKEARARVVDRIMMNFLSAFGSQMPPFGVRRTDVRPNNCVGDAEWEEGRPKLPEAGDE